MKTKDLGLFELKVLLAAFSLGETATGAAIERLLTTSFPKQDLAKGQIYSALKRLEAKTWIERIETSPVSIRGGRRAFVTKITENGIIELRTIWSDLLELGKNLL